jgi:hypothetical protein
MRSQARGVDVTPYPGIAISLAAIAAGIVLAVRTFLHPDYRLIPIPEE